MAAGVSADISVDMSADTCQPSVGRHIGRHVDTVSADRGAHITQDRNCAWHVIKVFLRY